MDNFSRSAVTAQEITDNSILEQIYALRVIAWRERTSIPDDTVSWIDSYDRDAQHWAVLVDDRPIAAARLTIHSNLADVPDAYIYGDILPELQSPICSINRCVVHPQFQNRGLSRRLDEARISAARQQNVRYVVASVDQDRRARSLKAAGFEFVGNGLPHTHGILAGTPNLIYLARFDMAGDSIETPNQLCYASRAFRTSPEATCSGRRR